MFVDVYILFENFYAPFISVYGLIGLAVGGLFLFGGSVVIGRKVFSFLLNWHSSFSQSRAGVANPNHIYSGFNMLLIAEEKNFNSDGEEASLD